MQQGKGKKSRTGLTGQQVCPNQFHCFFTAYVYLFLLVGDQFQALITDTDVLVHQPLAYYINVPFTELIHDETNFYLNTVIALGEKKPKLY